MAPGAALGFRGVLLRLAEADEATPAGSGGGGGAFRVLAPDAEMALPAAAACSANALSARATQALVVSDRVSARLLQRTGCSAALLQRETRSALWVEVAAGGDTPAGSGRCCYCFQFRSGVEFDMFERAVRAFLRAQQLALVENSVLLELELEAERQRRAKQQVAATLAPAAAGAAKKKKSQLSRAQGGAGTAPIAAAAARSVQRSRPPVASAVSANGALAKVAAPKTKPRPVEPVVREQQPQQQLSTACILCDTKAQGGKPLSMHPFVLQDARGEKCHVCKVCLQQILKRRVQNQAKLTTEAGEAESVCGLCAQHSSTFPQELKKCATPVCPRIYCTPCLHRLVGKARVSKVWRAKQWHCPNCTNYDTASSAEEGSSKQAATPSAPEPAAPAKAPGIKSSADELTKRKRKRQPENSSDNSAKSQPPKQPKQPKQLPNQQASASTTNVALAPDMEAVDYAANYFQFLIQREFAKSPGDESEDVCFCCKDGGELVECDWPGKEFKYARCPKVYHEDCLGYTVPENFEWKCPRHRCQACGIIAMYSCRFCVTSYCSEHVPADVKVIGQALKDMPENKYVMCANCDQHAQRALKEGKLSAKTHALLLRMPAKRK